MRVILNLFARDFNLAYDRLANRAVFFAGADCAAADLRDDARTIDRLVTLGAQFFSALANPERGEKTASKANHGAKREEYERHHG